MTDMIVYREMEASEVEAVAALVARVFRCVVAPFYMEEGVREVLRFGSAERLRERVRHDESFVLVAQADGGGLVGMIEMRGGDHVSLLFVDADYQRQGVGRTLLRRAVVRARAARPDLRQVTVHASPNAVSAYERLGFAATAAEQEADGILYTPMTLILTEESPEARQRTKEQEP
jgi:GNAT superfamily N-acetyltransferase